MSISPTSDIADPRRVGQPLRLTPDAGARPGIVETYAETGHAIGAPAAEGDELSFWDFLDVINPLQHIPVVSTIYRELTGDQIRAPARIAGGALFGGVIGLAAAAADMALKEASGRDAGEHVMALFGGDDDPAGSPKTAPTALAAQEAPADPAPTASTTAASLPAAAAADAGKPVVTAANTKWFPINRDQVRTDPPAPQPISEAARHGRPAAVEVLSPRPAGTEAAGTAPGAEAMPGAASLPLGVLSAASAVSAQAVPTAATTPGGPSPAALRRAMTAQGLSPRDDHPMLRGAAETPAAAAPAPTPAPTSVLPPSDGPVDVPAWFDKAMRRYSTSDRLTPSDIPAGGPVAAPVDRRGV
ncbi:hypothetical protein ACM64Y_04970 [Novispirillum sp. DQ9]|uniref:hypothetical protein n=1 Tax=Novispirillum sp. DQ9 TaxID=3398612 RepID=UPI003C7D520C